MGLRLGPNDGLRRLFALVPPVDQTKLQHRLLCPNERPRGLPLCRLSTGFCPCASYQRWVRRSLPLCCQTAVSALVPPTLRALRSGLALRSALALVPPNWRACLPLFRPQRHKGNPNNGLFIPLNNTVYMVLAIMPIMPENGLITDHNSCRIRCNRDPVVKPTQDQLVWGMNPTRISYPGTQG